MDLPAPFCVGQVLIVPKVFSFEEPSLKSITFIFLMYIPLYFNISTYNLHQLKRKVSVSVGQDHVPARPTILCFQVKMEEIPPAGEIRHEIVSDLCIPIQRNAWSRIVGSSVNSSSMIMLSFSPMSVS